MAAKDRPQYLLHVAQRKIARNEIVYELDEEIAPSVTRRPRKRCCRKISIRQLLRKLLDELPPAFREIIVLRDLEGLSYKEISSVTELPLGTVMSRLARARQAAAADAAAAATGVLG